MLVKRLDIASNLNINPDLRVVKSSGFGVFLWKGCIMSLRTKMKVINPADFEVELTMTMKLREWTQLAEHIDRDHWPASDLWAAITDMVSQIDETYQPKPESEG